jgi:hypothetical protein
MALTKIDGGWYESGTSEDPRHLYYDEAGKWLPSATQLLSLVGYSDYSRVPAATLERKRVIGKEAHDHCASIDLYGDVDPSWISDEARPYVEAYQLFRHQRRFVPDPEWVERPVITEIYGMRVGVTCDVFGKLDGYDAVLERKCVAVAKEAWAVQTALQELARFKGKHLGRAQRFAVQLLDTGKFKLAPHLNHGIDEFRAISALAVVYMRLDSGEKLWELV